MQKAEPQHKQNQPVQWKGGGASLESPQGEQITQLEAMIESSPQAGRLAELAAMMNNSPQATAQRRMMDTIRNSPRMAEQRKAISAIHNSPHVTAQRQQLGSLTGKTAQREEAEEPLQPKAAQREEAPAKPNNTGLPDNLKSGIESLSGMSMDNVRVHYNSSQPAQLNALAYAQGTDIHVAPGQEQHLPHEAWHVVQQAQGRVQPTMQMKNGVPVNDDQGLEREADVMGGRALQESRKIQTVPSATERSPAFQRLVSRQAGGNIPAQLLTKINHDTATFDAQGYGSGNFQVGTGMQAILDPNNPVAGSAASSKSTPLLDEICKLFNPRLQQTHLLNADLGGFGVYENLYPMTAKGNREHYNKVERHVKNALSKANTNLQTRNWNPSAQLPEKEGTGVYYTINVVGNHSYTALQGETQQFNCMAYYIDDVINAPVPNSAKPIVVDTVVSNPAGDNTNAPGWAGYSATPDTWSHTQGAMNPNASNWQKQYIDKREGKADLATTFSKYTPGKTWSDYRINNISLNSGNSGILSVAKSELRQQAIQSDFDTLAEHIQSISDEQFLPAAEQLKDVLETMLSNGEEFNHSYYIENYVYTKTCDEFTESLADKYCEFAWED